MIRKYFLSFFVVCLFLNCAHVSAQKNTDEEIIPATFKCTDCILLVIKPEDGDKRLLSKKEYSAYSGLIEKQFGKNYDGKYVIVTEKELGVNPAYRDSIIYRFILDVKGHNANGSMPRADGMGTFNYSYTALDIKLYDRQLSKAYQPFITKRTWPQAVETVVKTLEKKRG